MNPRRLTQLLLCLLPVLILARCGGTAASPSPFDPRGRDATGLVIEVENQNYNDVRLYAESVRGRRSLGIVASLGRETYRVDWPTVDNLQIRMEFLAGQTASSNRVTVGPGDRVELLITSIVRNSVLRRR